MWCVRESMEKKSDYPIFFLHPLTYIICRAIYESTENIFFIIQPSSIKISSNQVSYESDEWFRSAVRKVSLR